MQREADWGCVYGNGSWEGDESSGNSGWGGSHPTVMSKYPLADKVCKPGFLHFNFLDLTLLPTVCSQYGSWIKQLFFPSVSKLLFCEGFRNASPQ